MKLRSRNKITTEFNMSSMTDLVFLLLIFFMLLSTLVTNSNVIDLTLPKSSSTQKDPTKPVRVSVNSNLEYYVDNQMVSKEEIGPLLQSKLGDNPEAKVQVAIDEEVPHKYFVEVADIVSVQYRFKMVLVTDAQKN